MYRLVSLFLYGLFRFVFRCRVYGVENIPATGAVIIASNHIGNFDPPVIGCQLSRRIYFMAKEELFRVPILAGVIRWLGAFPVKRGSADRHAVKRMLEILVAGQVLGVFPEGTRGKNGVLGEPEPGMAMMALKTGTTVVPVAVKGTDFRGGGWPTFSVSFGKAIPVERTKPDKEMVDALSQRIMQEIGMLMTQKERK
nr:lysophospholipid acyltransferase family protein [uncultured Anaeromusa sp.]